MWPGESVDILHLVQLYPDNSRHFLIRANSVEYEVCEPVLRSGRVRDCTRFTDYTRIYNEYLGAPD